MLAKGLRFVAAVVLILALTLTLPCSDAMAQSRGEVRGASRAGHGPVGNNRGWNNGGRHYYRNGNWYRHGWFGLDIAVGALVIGALIDALPPKHTTVVVANTPYYYFDNYYYRPSPSGGYIVVPPPVLAPPVATMPQFAQPQPQNQGVLTVNIPNSRGGYTAVMLRRSSNGFVGPQGEYYSDNPTVAQLKVLYGR